VTGMRLALARRLSRAHRTRPKPVADSESRILKLEAITETALSHLALDVLLEELLDRIRGILDVETASILLLEGDVLVPTASKGFEEEVGVGIEIPMGKGFAGRVGATRRPVLLEDVNAIQVVNPLLRVKGLTSLLGVPLLHRGTLIGVFHVGTTTRREFTADDVVTVQLVADRVAMAIAQSRVYEAEREARGEAEAAQRRLAFLSEASRVLASSLDYATTVERMTELAVPEVADEVIVDLVDDDGTLSRVAVAHIDPAKADLIRELADRFPPSVEDDFGPAAVIKSGKPQVTASISDEMLALVAQDDEHLEAIRSLGLRSFMIVPLASRDRIFGAMTFIVSESERRYGADDLAFAHELGRRAAAAIDNARLFAEAEDRGRAVLVLDHVGEGVCLVDGNGIVRLWNPAAEAITGVRAGMVLGSRLGDTVPGWAGIEERIPVSEFPAPSHHLPETLPVDVGGREAWLLISGVRFGGGTVFAFHDVTEERSLRQLQTEFVATVSHELRTPLAAVYGAAMTLRQRADSLSDEVRDSLFSIVYEEADRLSHIVDDVLWASRLDAGRVEFAIRSLEPELVASSVVNAARTHAPSDIKFEVKTSTGVRPIAADEEKVRQVLGNLVDNAVKYSPDGGVVALRIEPNGATIRFLVADEGIGIPPSEQTRVFEKFYRLDPNQTRGVGGTGLGLYICRELVRRMNGRIWVDSEEGEGSTFFVELPVAEELAGAEVFAHIRA
jgi:signal transduction histidine kinase/GAF domain-containing protein